MKWEFWFDYFPLLGLSGKVKWWLLLVFPWPFPFGKGQNVIDARTPLTLWEGA